MLGFYYYKVEVSNDLKHHYTKQYKGFLSEDL